MTFKFKNKYIIEILNYASQQKDEEAIIKVLQNGSKINPSLIPFLRYAYFNKFDTPYASIPSYKVNYSPIDLCYSKLDKVLPKINFFTRTEMMIPNEKQRTDRLLSILESMNWEEANIFESLIMNKYENDKITKEIVMKAFPDKFKIQEVTE